MHGQEVWLHRGGDGLELGLLGNGRLEEPTCSSGYE